MNHSFDVNHAVKYGLHESILISHFEFWISKNIGNKRHQYDGKTWTYNSIKAFEDLFPYLSYKQIRTSIDGLVIAGVIVRGNYNQNTYDRTSWFAFSDEFLIANPLPCGANGRPLGANGVARKGKSLTSTDINTDSVEIGFASFWSAYPKKTAKPAAFTKFKSAKLKAGELDLILIDIETRKQCEDWAKENGKYVPNPATYLNQRRWEDGDTAHMQKPGGIIPGAI